MIHFWSKAAYLSLSYNIVFAATYSGTFVSDVAQCGRINHATFTSSKTTCISTNCAAFRPPSSASTFYTGAACLQNPLDYFDSVVKNSDTPYFATVTYNSTTCDNDAILSASITQASGECRSGQMTTFTVFTNGSVHQRYHGTYCKAANDTPISVTLDSSELDQCHVNSVSNHSVKMFILAGPKCRLSDGSRCTATQGYISTVSSSIRNFNKGLSWTTSVAISVMAGFLLL